MNEEIKKSEILAAMDGAPYKQANNRIAIIAGKIKELHRRRNYAIEEDELASKAMDLDQEVFRFYANDITLEELLLALDYGARAEYGDVKSLSVDSCFGWLRSYMASDARTAAIRERKTRLRVKPLSREDPNYADEVRRLNWEAMDAYLRDLWQHPEDRRPRLFSRLYEDARSINRAAALEWLRTCGASMFSPDYWKWLDANHGKQDAEEQLLALLDDLKKGGNDLAAMLDALEDATPMEERRFGKVMA